MWLQVPWGSGREKTQGPAPGSCLLLVCWVYGSHPLLRCYLRKATTLFQESRIPWAGAALPRLPPCRLLPQGSCTSLQPLKWFFSDSPLFGKRLRQGTDWGLPAIEEDFLFFFPLREPEESEWNNPTCVSPVAASATGVGGEQAPGPSQLQGTCGQPLLTASRHPSL